MEEILSDWDFLLLLGNSRQIQMNPLHFLHHISGEVIKMEPLHYDDDHILALVIQASSTRCYRTSYSHLTA